MTNNCQFWWNWWLNFFIAFGTISVAFLAIFGDKIRAYYFKPKLKITLRNSIGEPTQIRVLKQSGIIQGHAIYYHLKVSNKAKWPKSSNTQVFLHKVEQPGPSGLETIWEGEAPMEWMHQDLYPKARNIGAKDIMCDLISIVSAENEKYIELHPLIYPNSLVKKYLFATTFVLSFKAFGDEVESPICRIKVTWDGLWNDSRTEMRRHLVIEDISGQVNK
jgi:hypothetical protein